MSMEDLLVDFYNGAWALEKIAAWAYVGAHREEIRERVTAFEKSYAKLVDLHARGKLGVGAADFLPENLERARRLVLLLGSGPESQGPQHAAAEIHDLAERCLRSLTRTEAPAASTEPAPEPRSFIDQTELEVGATDRASFQTLGFPPRSTILRVVVSEPARCVVVQFQLQGDPPPARRLFVRRFDEELYRELVPHEEGHDIDDPTPSPTTPYVYFNRTLWKDWGGTRGGDWDGLFRVHCESLAVDCLLSSALSPSTRISRILGISGDGARLHVVGSSTKARVDGGTVDYGVADLDLATLEMRPLAALRATFV
jgi:hypothetical protein